MNKKTLIVLGIAAAVLAALVVVSNQSQQPSNILDQVTLEPLVPVGLGADEVGRIELYKGAVPAERVVLARSPRDNDEWIVATHFNAPVEQQRIQEFLANALGLRGEYRTTAQTDGGLEPFDLTDEAAFHVVGYGHADDMPLFHILVGKSPSFRTVFVRNHDNRTVFVEEIDLKRDAGIQQPFEETLDSSVITPKPDHWVRREVLALAQDTIERITMTTPGRTVELERRALPTPETETDPEADPEDDSDADDEDSAFAAPPEPEFEWVVAAGGPGGPLKSVGMDSLARRFNNLQGETIVDPARAAEYALEPPTHRMELAVEDEAEPVVIEAGRPDPTGPGYLRIAGSPHIYQVQSFTFDGLFPRATQLFDLPEVDMPLATVREVRTQRPEGAVHLIKDEDGEWAVAAPAAPLPVQQTTMDELARAAATWKPIDYVNADIDTGLDAPRYTLTTTREDGSSIEVRIGAPSPEGGTFVEFDGAPMPLRMSQTDLDRLFPSLSDLYQLALLDIDRDAVERVAVERAADEFTITRGDDGEWSITGGGVESGADDAAVTALLRAVDGLQAREIAFEWSDAPGEPEAVVRIAQGGGIESTVRFGPASDGFRWVTLDGMAGVFRVTAADASAILVDSAALRLPTDDAETDAGEDAEEDGSPADE